MKTIVSTAILLSCLSVPTVAAGDWLPESGQESLALQIAAKLGATHLGGEGTEESLLETARVAVSGIVDTIDAWGVDELTERAPELADLGLPTTENPHLQAIARYGACNFHLEALYGNTALDETAPSMRVSAAIASAAIPLATAHLRHHFLATGGTDEELLAFLTSDEMAAASLRIQDNREMISYSWKECAPTLAGLTESIMANPADSETDPEDAS